MNELPPPGWYRDPWDPQATRFWDGTAWTGHVRQPQPIMPAGAGKWDEQASRHRAGFGLRTAAFLIDGVVMNIVMFPITMYYMFEQFSQLGQMQFTTDGQLVNTLPDNFWSTYILLMLVSLLLPVVYAMLFEGGPHGQTIGKWAVSIQVRRPDGESPLGRGRALRRGFLRLGSMIVFYIGMLAMLWDKDARTWHDRGSDSRVYLQQQRPPFMDLVRSAFTGT